MGVNITVVPIPVTRVKRGKYGSLKLSMCPDRLVRAEYDSASKLDGESYGMQSGKLASYALYLGELDLAAKLMVQEHSDLSKFGSIGARPVPVLSFTLLDQSSTYGYTIHTFTEKRSSHGKDRKAPVPNA